VTEYCGVAGSVVFQSCPGRLIEIPEVFMVDPEIETGFSNSLLSLSYSFNISS
jgi:hypothetical protein